MKKISLIDISKNFGSQKILEGITFEANEDDFCVLVGPSGSGKTTILRIIAGLEEPSKGKILFNGTLWNDLPPGERNVGMVFQNYALYPHLTVYENIAFPLLIKKENKRKVEEKVRAIATLLNLQDKLNKKPKELSGGEKQRVALGRAIVREPNVFLFDEPLSNLDAKLRVVMRTEIVNLCKQLGIPSIYVTHDQVEALTMGTKVVVLKDGKIQQVGTPNEIFHTPQNTFVATFIGTPQMNLFDGEVQDGIFKEKNSFFTLDLRNYLNKLSTQLDEVTLGVRPEDIFLTNEENGIICANVKAFEYIGYETIVYFEHNGKLYSLITKEQTNLPIIGESIFLGIKEGSFHFFDKAGNRIDI
jgi:multiple sugar transport system ATP-binding protein